MGVAVCLEGRTAKRGGSSTTNICGACGAQERLRVPRRCRKKRLTGALTQVGSFCPIRPNVVWALDFQFNTTACGRKLKLLKRH